MTDKQWSTVFEALEKWHNEELKQSEQPLAVNEAANEYEKLGAERPWAVLVSTLISLRTKDEVTAIAGPRLLKKANTPQKMVQLAEAEIEKLIYPAGFYHTKAANLKHIAEILIAQYAGRVPDTEEALLALPGVGHKTAALVLDEGFHKDAICVDTHVHRISNRCGWVSTKTPDETQVALMKNLPRQFWRRINLILVRYGRNICTPLSPRCSQCVIGRGCERRGVTRTR
jgi:endonuclease-3